MPVLLNSDLATDAAGIMPCWNMWSRTPTQVPASRKYSATAIRGIRICGACGGYVDRDCYPYCRGRIFGVCEADKGQYDTPAEVFWASGAALMVRR